MRYRRIWRIVGSGCHATRSVHARREEASGDLGARRGRGRRAPQDVAGCCSRRTRLAGATAVGLCLCRPRGVSTGAAKRGTRQPGHGVQWPPLVRQWELTGLNRTWGSAYLSARRTYRLGELSAGPSAGRKYGLIRQPPLVLAEKMARGTAVPSASRRYGLIRHPPL